MPNPHIPLEPGKYYHIYNRGINRCDLFCEPDNYEYFLLLYEKYIESVADTYAWVLMGNHFHLLVQIKEIKEMGYYKPLNSDRSDDSARFQVTHDLSEFKEPERVKKPIPTRHFSHLFNTYAKYFNKKYNRTGSLFEHPFHRKEITDENYFKQLVTYIHNNPVYHDFCELPQEYQWSSYLSCTSSKPTKLQREKVIDWFDNIKNFKESHNQEIDINKIEKWLNL